MKRLAYGVGVFDGTYTMINGKQCRYYSTWREMLRRCYSDIDSDLIKNSTYSRCFVCQEWLTFSNFKSWMQTQDWEDKQLDKDILVDGNNEYSPLYCVFVTPKLNSFITERRKNNREFVGAYPYKDYYKSYISNPFTKKREFLGSSFTELEAHLLWKARKLELALDFPEVMVDEKLKKSLIKRFQG